MNIKNQPLSVRVFFSLGLLMVTMPSFINEYIKLPDFLRGFLVGTGLALEIMALVKMNRSKKVDSPC